MWAGKPFEKQDKLYLLLLHGKMGGVVGWKPLVLTCMPHTLWKKTRSRAYPQSPLHLHPAGGLPECCAERAAEEEAVMGIEMESCVLLLLLLLGAP